MDFTIRVAKTKALISFAVTAKLICVFVFAYTKTRFSHDEAHIGANCIGYRGRRLYIDRSFKYILIVSLQY